MKYVNLKYIYILFYSKIKNKYSKLYQLYMLIKFRHVNKNNTFLLPIFSILLKKIKFMNFKYKMLIKETFKCRKGRGQEA